jgi:hypothetical protein
MLLNPCGLPPPEGAHENHFKASTVVPLFAQRFAEAVQALIGDGPVKQRLATAYSSHLADLTEAELPPALRREFGELQAAMNRVAPVGNETRVRASVQKMSPNDAAGHAATIVKLYVELIIGVERAEPLKVVTPPRKTPRFLTGGRS